MLGVPLDVIIGYHGDLLVCFKILVWKFTERAVVSVCTHTFVSVNVYVLILR